ncbi:MAG: sigma-70 family RNA polymerase sigma factor [Nanoarchaeota archaeon]
MSNKRIDNTIMNYGEIAKKYPLLSKEDFNDHHSRMKKGDRHCPEKELLLLSNLRLVMKIANGYHHFNPSGDINEIIQNGLIGLDTGIERYDPSRGFQPSTYLSWWIKRSIIKTFKDESRTIRTPLHVYEKLSKYKKFLEDFTQKNNRDPRREEIEEADKEDEGVYLGYIAYQTSHVISIHSTKERNGDESGFEDELRWDGPGPVERIIEGKESITLEYLTSVLPPIERFVITQRFTTDKTLEEVAASLYESNSYILNREKPLSRERIRQIEKRALKIMSEKLETKVEV